MGNAGRMKERRRAGRRHLIHYLGVLDGSTGELIGRVVNISGDGVMLVRGDPIKTDVVFELQLVLPVQIGGSGEIPFQARSICCASNPSTGLYDTGFELLDVTKKDIAAIESLIDALGSIPESETVRILYMEDDAGLARLFQKRLAAVGYEVDIAGDGETGLSMLGQGSYDVLAVDHAVPGRDGLEVIRILASQGRLPATIMVSGSGNEGIAVEAMKLGADDYIVKDSDGGYLKLLPTVIEQALRRRRLMSEKLRAEQALEESESRLRSVLSSMDDSVLVFDREGRFSEHYTPAGPPFAPGQNLLGKKPSEVMPREVSQLFVKAFGEIESETVSQFEYPMLAGCETHWYSAKLSPMLLNDKFAGSVAVVRDITELVDYREELRRANEDLEERVQERTRELREAQSQLLAQQRLQQEMELAAQIQASLLPRELPHLDGFEFAAAASPARYVSGDLYDFVSRDSGSCHIVVADISGKGVPAALLTSTARTLLRAETEHEDSPSAILEKVNRTLYGDLAHAEMFITLLVAWLDARLGSLTLANAGHTETLWWRQGSGTFQTLPATGLPVGIRMESPVPDETILLRPGDAVVGYSDGITEAANERDELFGLERLKVTVAGHARASADDLSQAIMEAVEAFRGGAPLSDDVTLIVLKALPRMVSFAYPAKLDHLNEVTALVRQLASAYGDDFAFQWELAASEIVTNVTEHAYHGPPGDLRGRVSLLPDRLQLDVYDDGDAFDPARLEAPDVDSLSNRGRGLHIVRQLMDGVSYTPATPDGNRWRLVKLAEGSMP